VSFTIARTIEDALALMAEGARPIAGGSDLVVGARHGKAQLPDHLVAIDRVRQLRVIDHSSPACRIGAAVTHAELMIDEVIVDDYTALADAAALVGSPATRNVGTLGGNVMNGSPAMDTGAPLVVLGALVELRSTAQTRQVRIAELWIAPGETVARRDELCTTVELPPRPERSGSAYVRLEYRRAMEIAVVGAAASVRLDESGSVAEVSVALAAVAPTIIAVPDLEELVGQRVGAKFLAKIADAASRASRPISDVRASESYREHTVGVMARRAVEAAARRAAGETIVVPVNRAEGVGA
jgi:CO/xanthine dehydrogenase FAD-binding subunit